MHILCTMQKKKIHDKTFLHYEFGDVKENVVSRQEFLFIRDTIMCNK